MALCCGQPVRMGRSVCTPSTYIQYVEGVAAPEKVPGPHGEHARLEVAFIRAE
jgi:hypothetical protein